MNTRVVGYMVQVLYLPFTLLVDYIWYVHDTYSRDIQVSRICRLEIHMKSAKEEKLCKCLIVYSSSNIHAVALHST